MEQGVKKKRVSAESLSLGWVESGRHGYWLVELDEKPVERTVKLDFSWNGPLDLPSVWFETLGDCENEVCRWEAKVSKFHIKTGRFALSNLGGWQMELDGAAMRGVTGIHLVARVDELPRVEVTYYVGRLSE